jgi:para-aminobenzoate synthetase component 1
MAPAFLDLPYPVFLDSAAPGGTTGRYSYLAADPFMVLKSRGRTVTIETAAGRETCDADPLQALRSLLADHRSVKLPGLPPFQGGVIGYWSYDLGRLLERLPEWSEDDMGLPDLCLGFYDWCLAEDHLTGGTYLFSQPHPGPGDDHAAARMESVLDRIARVRENSRGLDADPPGARSPLRSNFTREGYLSAVRRVKEYLLAGDIYQANISQRFEVGFDGDPWALYQDLRRANPAPFAAYLGSPEATVLSASPELFLNLVGDRVETRPIKGTRPRGSSPESDRALARELCQSPKDRAENVMIVDLLRSDLGKLCRIGSVETPQLFALEGHPTVWHLVSTVTGALPPGLGAVDILGACFPGGSVTGAPKVRAMEIIEELEPVRRGVYCGAIGYMAFNGDMSTSIAIRTMVLSGGRLTFHAGGGIVADSDPEEEHQETLDKAAGLMRALGRRG